MIRNNVLLEAQEWPFIGEGEIIRDEKALSLFYSARRLSLFLRREIKESEVLNVNLSMRY